MDFTIIRDFGFPVFCCVCLGGVLWWWIKDTRAEVKELREFQRADMADMVAEAHTREREFVTIIRELHASRNPPPTVKSIVAEAGSPDHSERILRVTEPTPGHGSRVGRRSGEHRI